MADGVSTELQRAQPRKQQKFPLLGFQIPAGKWDFCSTENGMATETADVRFRAEAVTLQLGNVLE